MEALNEAARLIAQSIELLGTALIDCRDIEQELVLQSILALNDKALEALTKERSST